MKRKVKEHECGDKRRLAMIGGLSRAEPGHLFASLGEPVVFLLEILDSKRVRAGVRLYKSPTLPKSSSLSKCRPQPNSCSRLSMTCNINSPMKRYPLHSRAIVLWWCPDQFRINVSPMPQISGSAATVALQHCGSMALKYCSFQHYCDTRSGVVALWRCRVVETEACASVYTIKVSTSFVSTLDQTSLSVSRVASWTD